MSMSADVSQLCQDGSETLSLHSNSQQTEHAQLTSEDKSCSLSNLDGQEKGIHAPSSSDLLISTCTQVNTVPMLDSNSQIDSITHSVPSSSTTTSNPSVVPENTQSNSTEHSFAVSFDSGVVDLNTPPASTTSDNEHGPIAIHPSLSVFDTVEEGWTGMNVICPTDLKYSRRSASSVISQSSSLLCGNGPSSIPPLSVSDAVDDGWSNKAVSSYKNREPCQTNCLTTGSSFPSNHESETLAACPLSDVEAVEEGWSSKKVTDPTITTRRHNIFQGSSPPSDVSPHSTLLNNPMSTVKLSPLDIAEEGYTTSSKVCVNAPLSHKLFKKEAHPYDLEFNGYNSAVEAVQEVHSDSKAVELSEEACFVSLPDIVISESSPPTTMNTGSIIAVSSPVPPDKDPGQGEKKKSSVDTDILADSVIEMSPVASCFTLSHDNKMNNSGSSTAISVSKALVSARLACGRPRCMQRRNTNTRTAKEQDLPHPLCHSIRAPSSNSPTHQGQAGLGQDNHYVSQIYGLFNSTFLKVIPQCAS